MLHQWLGLEDRNKKYFCCGFKERIIVVVTCNFFSKNKTFSVVSNLSANLGHNGFVCAWTLVKILQFY